MGRNSGRRVLLGGSLALTPENFVVPFPQPFGEVPVGGSFYGIGEVKGKFGERLTRSRGDFVQLDSIRLSVKSKVRKQLLEIEDRAAILPAADRQRYLDGAYQHFNKNLQDAREQFDIYGPNSQQGRVLDQVIRSNVYARQVVEDLAGGISQGRPNFSPIARSRSDDS